MEPYRRRPFRHYRYRTNLVGGPKHYQLSDGTVIETAIPLMASLNRRSRRRIAKSQRPCPLHLRHPRQARRR